MEFITTIHSNYAILHCYNYKERHIIQTTFLQYVKRIYKICNNVNIIFVYLNDITYIISNYNRVNTISIYEQKQKSDILKLKPSNILRIEMTLTYWGCIFNFQSLIAISTMMNEYLENNINTYYKNKQNRPYDIYHIEDIKLKKNKYIW